MMCLKQTDDKAVSRVTLATDNQKHTNLSSFFFLGLLQSQEHNYEFFNTNKIQKSYLALSLFPPVFFLSCFLDLSLLLDLLESELESLLDSELESLLELLLELESLLNKRRNKFL